MLATLTFPNGDAYVGNFVANAFHGRGTFTYAAGDRYAGEWASGQPEGVPFANDDVAVIVE